MRENALIVVAKKPVPGRTKTRLCPPLNPQSAAELYRCLLLDTLTLMQRVDNADPCLAFTPDSARGYFAGLVPHDFRLVPQKGADLGQRLSNALAHHLGLGYERVVIMNSDGPSLPTDHLLEAFHSLDKADISLGPGHDGGYYLIGMKRLYPQLFEGIAWSTQHVIPQTLDVCRRLGLTVHMLPEWYDVDIGEDLERLRQDLALNPVLAPCTSALLESLPTTNAIHKDVDNVYDGEISSLGAPTTL